jgi:hypothetical protein
MGSFLTKVVEKFECESSCSINHELHEEADNIKFGKIKLSQAEIKVINKIIKKNSNIT